MGGAQYQVKHLIDALEEDGRFDLSFIGKDVPRRVSSDAYRLLRIRSRPGPVAPLADALPLYRTLRRVQPDIVYQRVGCAYTGIAAAYCRAHGARLVYHISNMRDLMPLRMSLRRDLIGALTNRRLLDYGICHAHAIIAQTEEQAALLSARYWRRPDAIVPNFHPVPAQVAKKPTVPHLVWLANLKETKQPERFIDLARQLRARGITARFVMAGRLQGGRRWRGRMRELLERSPHVHYLGPVTQAQANALLDKAHLAVNTSVVEGFSNVFIQAWMRGVPVLSLHVDPDGILVQSGLGRCSGDSDRLVTDAVELLRDPEALARMGRTARRYAITHHSLRNREELVRLFRDLLSDAMKEAPALP